MSDKLKPGLSVLVTFNVGEAPTPAKLNAITSQVRAALLRLESAVGDVYGSSWPYTSDNTSTLSSKASYSRNTNLALSGSVERKTDIVNLARLIGPSSNLNPRMLNGIQSIDETTPVGVYEFALRYPIAGTLSATNPFFTDTACSNFVGSPTGLVNAGDYYVTPEGKVFCVSISLGGTATYSVNPSKFGGGIASTASTFNVIPDPNQIAAGGLGCSVGAIDGFGRRLVTLPLATHQQSNYAGNAITLSASDMNYQKQLSLPAVLIDNFSAGVEIPSGFLFLKNETTSEIYTQATYQYNNSTSYYVKDVDLTTAVSLGHKFSTLTVGTSITSAIDDLRVKSHHSHDRSFGEPFINVESIAGQTELAGQSGPFTASDNPSNYFPQYLHRDGYRVGIDDNINDQNVMRGDLIIGRSAGTPGTYIGAGESYSLKFGDVSATSPVLLRDTNEDFLMRNTGGDIIVDPVSSGVVKTTSLLVPEAGISGPDYDAGMKVLGLAGIAPYVLRGTFTGDYSLGAGTRVTLSLAGDILAKYWVDVRLAFFIPAINLWIPADHSTSTTRVSGDAYSFSTSWTELGGPVSSLKINFVGADWAVLYGAGAPALSYNLVIWYIPS